MSERGTVRARRLADGTGVRVMPDGSTRLAAMMQAEIEANARADLGAIGRGGCSQGWVPAGPVRRLRRW